MKTRESADDEWRRLLKGGFCFETAPFAVHPLDHQRAERMIFVATRAGASKPEILEAALRYLRDDRRVHVDFLNTELARVETFLNRYALTGKAKHAWLVFFNGSESPVTDTTSRLVQALDPRISERRILDFLEFHYRAIEYTSREILYYSTRSNKNPYRAGVNVSKDDRLLSYTCGHNPWLEARFCRNILIWDVEGGADKVTWTEESYEHNI